MENLMIELQFHGLFRSIGKHLLDLPIEVIPFVMSPEVVNHEEAAVEEIIVARP